MTLAQRHRPVDMARVPFGVRRPGMCFGEGLPIFPIVRIGRRERLDGSERLFAERCAFGKSALPETDGAKIGQPVLNFHSPFHVVRIERDHSVREPLVLVELPRGLVKLTAAVRDLADVKDVLSMFEQPLRVVGAAADRLRRSGQRLAIKPKRAVGISALGRDLRHQAQRLRALRQG